jgi:ribosomal protein S18 acetylase RimI-like enzyme
VAVKGRQVVGAVLCGHDGRRGLIYHLAVSPRHQGRGLGRRLIEESLAGLTAAGLQRVLILVAKDNREGRAFWLARGFEDVSRARVMGVDLVAD